MVMGLLLISCSGGNEGESTSSFSALPEEGVIDIPLYIASSDPSTKEISYVTNLSLGAYITPELGSDRAYLSLDSYIHDYYLEQSLLYSQTQSGRSGPVEGVYRYDFRIQDSDTGEVKDKDYLEIDVNNDTIKISSLYGLLFKGATSHPLNMGAIPGEESIHTSAQEPYSEATNPLTFDYGSYGFDEIIEGDEIYLPPLIISTLLSYGSPIVYNGQAFFDI